MVIREDEKLTPYAGKITLNSRSITGAYETLTGNTRKGVSLAGKPMSKDELTGLLSFVEISTMSDYIYFDGTLPPQDVDELTLNVQEMKRQAKDTIGTDEMLSIHAIEVQNARELVGFCKQAAEQSSELIRNINLDRLDSSSYDKRLDNSEAEDVVKSFEGKVFAQYASPDDRAREAEMIASDVVEGRSTFRGSKCVIGLLTAECDEFDLLNDVATKFRNCSDQLKYYLVPALINRFRINYLSGLSADRKKASYQADLGIAGLRHQHNLFLWHYLLRKLRKVYEGDESALVKVIFSKHLSVLPVGFIAIMNAKKGAPFTLLEEALELREPIMKSTRVAEKVTRIFAHECDSAEAEALAIERIDDFFMALNRGEKKPVPKWYEVLIDVSPIVIGTPFAIFLQSLADDIGMKVLLGMSAGGHTAAATKVVDALLQPNRVYNTAVDRFQYFKNFYESIMQNEKAARSLSDQVNYVFNRPLGL